MDRPAKNPLDRRTLLVGGIAAAMWHPSPARSLPAAVLPPCATACRLSAGMKAFGKAFTAATMAPASH